MNYVLVNDLTTSIIAVVALIIIWKSPAFHGRKWLLAFVGFSALTNLLHYFPILLMECRVLIEPWVVFQSDHGHAIDYFLTVGSWVCLVGFATSLRFPRDEAVDAKRTYEAEGEKAGAPGGAIEVKVGFSWPCFLFGPIWAWSKGMIGIGFALLLGNVTFIALATLLEWVSLGHVMMPYNGRPFFPGWVFESLLTLLILGGWLFTVSLFANSWYEKALVKRGYRRVRSAPGTE